MLLFRCNHLRRFGQGCSAESPGEHLESVRSLHERDLSSGSGVPKTAGCHTLRHSFATHLLAARLKQMDSHRDTEAQRRSHFCASVSLCEPGSYPAAPSPRSTSVAVGAERIWTRVSSSRSRRLKV